MTIQPPPETRECGQCQACCFAVAVESEPISKNAWVTCEHQCKKGCAIYETRPQACRVYRCMWKLGWGQRKHRPDRLGLVIESPAPGCGIFLKEVKPGALETKEGRRVLGLLKAQEPVFITRFLNPYALGFTGTRQQLNECVKNLAALPGSLGEATRRFMLERAQNFEEKTV